MRPAKGHQLLSDVEQRTACVDTEATVNFSRPLMRLDYESSTALRPIDLLVPHATIVASMTCSSNSVEISYQPLETRDELLEI